MDLSSFPWGEVLAGIGTIAGGVALLRQRRTERAAQEVAGAAAIINGYDQLVKTLQSRLAQVEAELTKLQGELVTMRAENEGLRVKVRQLEDERAGLLAQLARLEAQVSGREGQPCSGE